MYSIRLVLILSLALIFTISQIETACKFRNVECESLDKSFAGVEYCYLKVVNRSYGYFSVRVNIFKLPITKAAVAFSLNKRANGYKPFLYNITMDVCKFFKSKKSFPVAMYFHQLFEKYSNMNHSCPYTTDFIVDKLDNRFVDDRMTNMLPIPRGRYAFFSTWIAQDIPVASVKVYFDLD